MAGKLCPEEIEDYKQNTHMFVYIKTEARIEEGVF